jgi:hypothetical protein
MNAANLLTKGSFYIIQQTILSHKFNYILRFNYLQIIYCWNTFFSILFRC